MKRVVVMTAIVAAIATSSSTALACDPSGANPDSLLVPFANATVPLNATLAIYNGVMGGVSTTPLLDGPEGEQPLRSDDNGGTLPPATLLVGPHTLMVPTYDGDRTFDFEVEDRVDDEAPVVRAEVHRERDRFGVEPCSVGIPSFTPVYGVSFIDDVDDTHVVLATPDGAWAIEAGVARVEQYGEQYGEPPALTVVDLAGNRGIVEIVDSGGCASMPASTSLLAALLLFVRRRRNA